MALFMRLSRLSIPLSVPPPESCSSLELHEAKAWPTCEADKIIARSFALRSLPPSTCPSLCLGDEFKHTARVGPMIQTFDPLRFPPTGGSKKTLLSALPCITTVPSAFNYCIWSIPASVI